MKTDLDNVFFIVLKWLKQGEDLVVITILRREGSAPRAPGTSMLISSAGKQWGTIGGGKVEAQVVLAARKTLKKGKNQRLCFNSEVKEGAEPDMICGGSLDIFLEYVPADTCNLELWQDAWRFYEKREKIFMCISLSENTGHHRFFIHENGTLYGKCEHFILEGLQKLLPKIQQTQLISLEGKEVMAMPCTSPPDLYIFGAGHVAGELAPLAVHLGFDVSVMDDRSAYLDGDAFINTRRILVPGFKQCLQHIRMDENSYMLIMTRDHQYDQELLAQILRTPACFKGMLGSKRKRDVIFKNLMNQGFTVEELQKVICPVGLTISADSPAEIAISIMAQLIQHRAGRFK